MTINETCRQSWQKLSDYIDELLPDETREELERHLEACPDCRNVLKGMQNIVELSHEQALFSPPENFSRSLRHFIEDRLATTSKGISDEVPLGITNDMVAPGSHLIYFWKTNTEFENGVRFLYPGLGRDEHCIIFGHDEALNHVKEVLRDNGYDPDDLISRSKLTVLRRHAGAQQTLAEIAKAVESALASGATLIRFLGNLGLGAAPLPAGEDDVLMLENGATALTSELPCVVVCMYDIKTVPGKLIFQGGLESHHLSVCGDSLHKNPFFKAGTELQHRAQ